LVGNKHVLDKLAEMLVEKETVDSEELSQLLIASEVKMAPIV
jgi:cell division protease FtsH